MSTIRTVRLSAPSRPTLEGAGVHLRRAFGNGRERLFDPFLMLDDFRGDDPSQYEAGFPWHPHRGIETITYVLEGEVEHGDSMGNAGRIGPGDVQWMTAGSGIIHQEMPHGDARGRMGGFQLWANLAAREKMTDPRYAGIEAADIPMVQVHGAEVRVICGVVAGTTGPVRDIKIDPEYLDVTLRPGATWNHPTPWGHTVFAYVFEGSATIGEPGSPSGDRASDGTVGARGDSGKESGEASGGAPGTPAADGRLGTIALMGDGDLFSATAGPLGARFLLVSGKPLREPIAWGGPIVMNTDEELNLAWRELREGTFVKHAGAGSP